MVERLVINTGPLIALARMDALDVIGQLPLEFICPREVREELDVGAAQGYAVVAPTWLTVVPLASPLSPVTVAKWFVKLVISHQRHPGEAPGEASSFHVQ